MDEPTVEVKVETLKMLVQFCQQPEIVAATDGAFDPDAYVQEAKRLIEGYYTEQEAVIF